MTEAGVVAAVLSGAFTGRVVGGFGGRCAAGSAEAVPTAVGVGGVSSILSAGSERSSACVKVSSDRSMGEAPVSGVSVGGISEAMVVNME